jgi:3-methyladenine DNA glycosylase AlkD
MWIEKYIDNWAKCDGFCNHTVGDLIMKYPQDIEELKAWASSNQRWLKRASAVSLIIPARKGMYLQDIFEIAQRLLTDPDDMVQKGYGWMLKESSRIHQDEVFQFVYDNKKQMPRTALRYAIELMPAEMRKEAMKRDW